MKVNFDPIEMYPVYVELGEEDMSSDYVPGYKLDVDESTLERWRKADEEFTRAQHEIAEAIKKRYPPKQDVVDTSYIAGISARIRRRDLEVAKVLELDPNRVVESSLVVYGSVAEWTEFDAETKSLVPRSVEMSREQMEQIRAMDK